MEIEYWNYNCEVTTGDEPGVGVVRVTGDCSQGACDWGESTVYLSDQGWYRAIYYTGRTVQRIIFFRESDGKLTVVDRTSYNDGSGRADEEAWSYFSKS
jgi:hypothetical protein